MSTCKTIQVIHEQKMKWSNTVNDLLKAKILKKKEEEEDDITFSHPLKDIRSTCSLLHKIINFTSLHTGVNCSPIQIEHQINTWAQNLFPTILMWLWVSMCVGVIL